MSARVTRSLRLRTKAKKIHFDSSEEREKEMEGQMQTSSVSKKTGIHRAPHPSESVNKLYFPAWKKDANYEGAEKDTPEPEEEDAAEDEDNDGQADEDDMDIDADDGEAEIEAEGDSEPADEVSPSNSQYPPRKGGSPSKGKTSPNKPSLKIKLKFSGMNMDATPTPTPSDEMPTRSARKVSSRRVEESEDEVESDESRSPSVVPPTRMTQRQAALAGITESASLSVLEEPESKKKKQLSEVELALRREETARKRKNLTEKKLEDEKTETINRLLKRQSRPRGKKARVVDPEEEGDENDEEFTPAAIPTPPEIPTMFRWISTTKQDCPALSFSVPPSLMDDPEALLKRTSEPPKAREIPKCDVSGCRQPRKYKLVKDPSRGGCGMEHLKALQVAMT